LFTIKGNSGALKFLNTASSSESKNRSVKLTVTSAVCAFVAETNIKTVKIKQKIFFVIFTPRP
jgi:hypothetical protein